MMKRLLAIIVFLVVLVAWFLMNSAGTNAIGEDQIEQVTPATAMNSDSIKVKDSTLYLKR